MRNDFKSPIDGGSHDSSFSLKSSVCACATSNESVLFERCVRKTTKANTKTKPAKPSTVQMLVGVFSASCLSTTDIATISSGSRDTTKQTHNEFRIRTSVVRYCSEPARVVFVVQRSMHRVALRRWRQRARRSLRRRASTTARSRRSARARFGTASCRTKTVDRRR